MEIRTIAPDLSVSPQLQPEDVATAAAQGFKSLILNRPDGESGDQPSREAIEDAAGQHGLKLRYVPVIAGDLKDADVTVDFAGETTPNDVVSIIATEPLTTDGL